MSVDAGAKAEFNVHADRYYVATVETTCWQCRRSTLVVGMIVPAGFKMIEEGEEGLEVVEQDDAAFVQYIGRIPPTVAERLQLVTSKSFIDSRHLRRWR